ncbi:FeS cluster assembly protein SufB [bacterium HR19]|nr:FeS cluster assembly protein SufB [bacterium HR19]
MQEIKGRYIRVKLPDNLKSVEWRKSDSETRVQVFLKLFNKEREKNQVFVFADEGIFIANSNVKSDIRTNKAEIGDTSFETNELALFIFESSDVFLIFGENQANYVSSISITVESGISVNLFEIWKTPPQSSSFNITKIYLKPSSSLKLLFLENTEESSLVVQKKKFFISESSDMYGGNIWRGLGKTFVSEEVYLDGDESSLRDFHLCLGEGKKKLEVNYKVFHRGKRTKSFVSSKIILKDSSEIAFLEDAEIENSALDSDSYVEGKSLILSEKAKNFLIPSMNIGVNIVKAKHSASCSRVGEKELFYLMSRGLDRETAEKLIIYGFISEILNEFPLKRFIPKLPDFPQDLLL